MDQTRSFVDFLREQRGGETEVELSKAMQTVIHAVTTQEKKAKIVLTIEVEPSKGAGQVIVSDEITVKLPKPRRSASVFYATPENNLTRTDPRQQALALRAVEIVPPVMKAIADEVSNG